MRSVSYLSIASFASILGAVFIIMVSVGVSGRRVELVVAKSGGVTLAEGFGAVSNIVFAYAGHLAFFSFISEMRDPREYPKALCCLQVADTVLYLVVAVVVYRFAGEEVVSPALGSGGAVVEKVAYGVAVPTIVVAGVINGHVAAVGEVSGCCVGGG